jgi:hypothetical protein
MSGCGQHQPARPRFERIENNHGPIKERPEAFQTKKNVQRKTVGRAGGEAEAVGEFFLLDFVQGGPDAVAAVAGGIGIMEEEQIEFLGAAAFEGFFHRHAQIAVVVGRRTERGDGKAGIAAGALAAALVEVVSHRADEAITGAGQAVEGATEQGIGGAGAIDIGGDEGADAALVSQTDKPNPALLGERLAKIHEAAAAPGSKSSSSNIHRIDETDLSNL